MVKHLIIITNIVGVWYCGLDDVDVWRQKSVYIRPKQGLEIEDRINGGFTSQPKRVAMRQYPETGNHPEVG